MSNDKASAAYYPDVPLEARQAKARDEVRRFTRKGYTIKSIDANGVTYVLERRRKIALVHYVIAGLTLGLYLFVLLRLMSHRPVDTAVVSVDRFGKVAVS